MIIVRIFTFQSIYFCDDSFNVWTNFLVANQTWRRSHLLLFLLLQELFQVILEFMDFQNVLDYFLAAQPFGFISDILNLNRPKLEWRRVDQAGNIPRDAIKLRPFSSLVHHYCRVTQVWRQNEVQVMPDYNAMECRLGIRRSSKMFQQMIK